MIVEVSLVGETFTAERAMILFAASNSFSLLLIAEVECEDVTTEIGEDVEAFVAQWNWTGEVAGFWICNELAVIKEMLAECCCRLESLAAWIVIAIVEQIFVLCLHVIFELRFS